MATIINVCANLGDFVGYSKRWISGSQPRAEGSDRRDVRDMVDLANYVLEVAGCVAVVGKHGGPAHLRVDHVGATW